MSVKRPSRRAVLIGVAGLGLLAGVGVWRATAKGPRVAGTTDATGAFLHDWIHIGSDGTVTIRTGFSEMGQGAFTGVATLVAEELGCRLDQIRVETGPASDAFKNIAVGRDILFPNRGLAQPEDASFVGSTITFVAEAATQQITGGSSTIADRFIRAREAGALARSLLIAAAARQWGVAATDCAAKDGAVVHAASKRSLGFGELAKAAASEAPPASLALKPRSAWTLIGGTVPRFDIPAKVDGSAQYGIDVRRPGMLFAAVANCPVFGGVLKSFDDTAAKTMPGVVRILAVPGGVAAVADSTWRAKRALAAVKIAWDDDSHSALDSAGVAKTLSDALGSAKKVSAEGDFAAAFAGAPKNCRPTMPCPIWPMRRWSR